MILLIYGDEPYLVRQKLRQIRDRAVKQGIDQTNTAELDGLTAEPRVVREAVMAQPFIAKQRLVAVRDWLIDRPAADGEALAEALAEVPDTTIAVVAEFGEPDKRRAGFKRIKKAAAKEWHLTKLDPGAATRWVPTYAKQQGTQIDAGAARHLVGLVGADLWSLASEIDKLATAASGGAITVELINKLVTDAAPSDIFALVDALGHRDAKTALTQWRRLLDDGEPALRIFAMVVRQFRILIMVTALHAQKKSQPEIAKELSLHPFVVQKAIAQTRSFTERSLRGIYHQFAELDHQIKTGQREAEPALELLLAEICGAKEPG